MQPRCMLDNSTADYMTNFMCECKLDDANMYVLLVTCVERHSGCVLLVKSETCMFVEASHSSGKFSSSAKPPHAVVVLSMVHPRQLSRYTYRTHMFVEVALVVH
jgi:hypothetical protein